MSAAQLMAAIEPYYAISLIFAVLLVVFFPLTRGWKSRAEKRKYYQIQLITFLGALLGAKLAVLLGDGLWPIKPFSDWAALLLSGRSIVGALLFGFIFAELAKPIFRYNRPPNDRFALVLPFSIAIGRIGCWLSGCCLGLDLNPPLGPFDRHPIALYEIVFYVLIGTLMIRAYQARRLQGQLFAVFMVAYGTFRFVCEIVRATEKAFLGLSGYQLLALALIIAGLISFHARRNVLLPGKFGYEQ